MSPAGIPVRLPPREVTVDERHAGQRIDNFLGNFLKGLPRSRIYRILRRGEVRVNRGRIRQGYRLRPGDVVRVPPVTLEPTQGPVLPGQAVLERVRAAQIFEHRDLLVLDKPAGMAVHGGSGLSYGMIEALRALRPEARFLELVHRIDRETSGCLMVACRRSVLVALHDQLRRGDVRKGYLCLMAGSWQGARRRVSIPLDKNVLRSGERVVRPADDGKPAVTVFEPLAVAAAASLVLARPLTGRTHQIRVHAAAIGHPLGGDPKYGDRAGDEPLRRAGLKRLFLHAHALDFRHPADERMLRVRAPLPEGLSRVLRRLGLAIPGRIWDDGDG